MEQPKVFFKHIRTLKPEGTINSKGGFTLAAKHVDNTWMFAAAFCHPKDLFCKRIGRAKAAGRLISPHWNLTIDSELISKMKTSEILDEVAKIIAQDYHEYETNLALHRKKHIFYTTFGVSYKGKVQPLFNNTSLTN